MTPPTVDERVRLPVPSEREREAGTVPRAWAPGPEPATDTAGAPGDAGPTAPDPERLLSVRGLEVRHQQATVLTGLDLDLDGGQVLAVVGPSGGGKSTLLRALAGLHRPAGGVVMLAGRDVTGRPPHRIARMGVATVAAGREAGGELTVAESLRLAAGPGGAGRWETVERLFGDLRGRGGQRVDSLSGGERQQLALAQAVLAGPELLLVDDLSRGLAPAMVAAVTEAVTEIARAGTGVVLVEQAVELALDMASRALFLDRGRVLFSGSVDDLLARPALLRSVFLHRTGRGSVRAPAPPPAAGEPLLRLTGVGASYGGTRALDGVDLEVGAGEVVGLVGPNGAGKSTLLDVVTGFLPADGGRVWLEGRELGATPAHARAAMGLVRSAQTPRLFGGLTVLECVTLARERHLAVHDPLRAAVWAPSARRSEARARAEAIEQLDRLGLADLATHAAPQLSLGQRRLVELACALAAEPRVLALDEPCAGLAAPDRLRVRDLLGAVAATGVGVVLVEHDLDVVSAACHRVLVLHLGRPLATGPPAAVLEDQTVVDAYVGAAGGARGRVARALEPSNDQGAPR